MKGDFSRIRYNPARHYTAVLKQQGRVDLDADANEQCFIDRALDETRNRDVIGDYGAPEDHAGFAIQIVGERILIGPGRYYVAGILVENAAWLDYDRQPGLVAAAVPARDLLEQLLQAGESAALQFELQVWQRLATDLDDPCLREPALGQADTTVRLQTVWRVLATVGEAASSTPSSAVTTGAAPRKQNPISRLSACCQALYRQTAAEHGGEMGAAVAAAGNDCGCQPIAAAGYQGLENQLYRVEIHQGGDLSTATFKWSRENGSVVTQVTAVGTNSPTVTVASLGPDANLGFQAGQWVELSDDTFQFAATPNQPGILYQIYSVEAASLQVTMTTPIYGIDPTQNARMRRWDQSGAAAGAQGIALSSTPIALENGIEVDFRQGDFQPGDYWTIPARTANGQIDWPPCGGNGRHFQPAQSMRVHRAPLACAHARAFYAYEESEDAVIAARNQGTDDGRFLISDCRLLFPPLIALNADTTPTALHVTAISWTNDDVMTTDTLLQNGLSITFDQPTTCPWGGGNFKVTLELPFGGDTLATLEGIFPGIPAPTFPSPAGSDVFLRTVMALDPPWGVDVNGTTVSWITPSATSGVATYAPFTVYGSLNNLLTWATPKGFARVRVELPGDAVYGNGPDGNSYLDGASFGSTALRTADGSERIDCVLPSGNGVAASDFKGWFYLAPTLVISNLTIQLLNGSSVVGTNAVTVEVDSNNNITGLVVTGPAGVPLTPVTAIQAVINFSYTPVSPVNLTLQLTGTGASTVATIQTSVTVPAGQNPVAVPITILSNPGTGPAGPVIDTLTLSASVAGLYYPIPFATPLPTLAVTGSAPPIVIFRPGAVSFINPVKKN